MGKGPKLCKGPKAKDPGPKEGRKGPKMSDFGPKGNSANNTHNAKFHRMFTKLEKRCV